MIFNLFIFTLYIFSQKIFVDRVIVSINSEIITFRDLQKSYELRLISRNSNEEDLEYLKRSLEFLINQKIVLSSFRTDHEITEKDLEKEEMRIIEELDGVDNLEKKFKYLKINWQDFRKILLTKVKYDRIIENEFSERIIVSFDEIENYYKENYLPSREKMKLNKEPFLNISSEIERELREKKSKELFNEWITEVKKIKEINIFLDEDDLKMILRGK